MYVWADKPGSYWGLLLPEPAFGQHKVLHGGLKAQPLSCTARAVPQITRGEVHRAAVLVGSAGTCKLAERAGCVPGLRVTRFVVGGTGDLTGRKGEVLATSQALDLITVFLPSLSPGSPQTYASKRGGICLMVASRRAYPFLSNHPPPHRMPHVPFWHSFINAGGRG